MSSVAEYNIATTYLKYYIIGNEAFTIDKILIKNLIFSANSNLLNVPMVIQQVTEYFQNFGTIVSIKFDEIDENGANYKGTVEFAESEAVVRLLHKKRHRVGEYIRYFGVQPNYSWEQPDVKDITLFFEKFSTADNQSEYSTSFYNKNKTPILDLNEDCLRYIFNYLPLRDHFNFALTCQRLFDIFQMILIRKYKNLETGILESLKYWQIKLFLKIVGTSVQTLEIRFLPDEIIPLIGSNCVNVKTLIVLEVRFFKNTWRTLIGNMKLLSKVRLDKITLECRDDLLFLVQSSPNIKSFSLEECQHSFALEHILEFRCLEELAIDACHSFCDYPYSAICSQFKNLRRLRLINEDVIDCEIIFKNQLQLESLELYGLLKNFHLIAKLPNLRTLELRQLCEEDKLRNEEQFFEDLYKYQRTRLEELYLYDPNFINLKRATLISEFKSLTVLFCSDNQQLCDSSLKELSKLTELKSLNISCCNVTNDGVLYLIENCPKLECLEICSIRSLTGTLLTNMLRILKRQHNLLKRDKCLKISVDENLYDDVLLRKSELMKSWNILQISYYAHVKPFLSSSEDEDEDDYINF